MKKENEVLIGTLFKSIGGKLKKSGKKLTARILISEMNTKTFSIVIVHGTKMTTVWITLENGHPYFHKVQTDCESIGVTVNPFDSWETPAKPSSARKLNFDVECSVDVNLECSEELEEDSNEEEETLTSDSSSYEARLKTPAQTRATFSSVFNEH